MKKFLSSLCLLTSLILITEVKAYIPDGTGNYFLPTGALLDMSSLIPSGAGLGISLPQTTDCSSATDEGQICWDTDGDDLYVGNGDSSTIQINGGGGGGGAATEIQTNTTFAFSTAGEIGMDTDCDGSNITGGCINVYDGTSQYEVYGASTGPTTDGQVLTYDSGTFSVGWEAPGLQTGTSFAFTTAGEIGMDTNCDNSNITTGCINVHDGTSQYEVYGASTGPTTDGQVLTYDSGSFSVGWEAPGLQTGTSFAFTTAGEIGMDTNCDNSNITTGCINVHDGTSQYEVYGASTGPTTDGQVLTYDSTGFNVVWEAPKAMGGATAVTSLPMCDSGNEGTLALVNDASDSTDCMTGGGATYNVCLCVNSSWDDLGNY